MTADVQDRQLYVVHALVSCPVDAKPQMLKSMAGSVLDKIWVPSSDVLKCVVRHSAQTPQILGGSAAFLKAYGEAVSQERAVEYLLEMKRPLARSTTIAFNDKAGLSAFITDVIKELQAPAVLKALAASMKNSL